MELRKVVQIVETVYAEGGETAGTPIVRAAAVAVIANPFSGRYVADLTPLWDIGGQLGERLMETLVARLERPVVSYGKGAVVGPLGDFEHGGALVHPKLGKPMRAAIGGGKAVIPSNVKIGAPGTPIDVPLGHKDDPWSFDHFDTMTVAVSDSPRPNELMMVVAIADGGRVNPRCGSAPVVD